MVNRYKNLSQFMHDISIVEDMRCMSVCDPSINIRFNRTLTPEERGSTSLKTICQSIDLYSNEFGTKFYDLWYRYNEINENSGMFEDLKLKNFWITGGFFRNGKNLDARGIGIDKYNSFLCDDMQGYPTINFEYVVDFSTEEKMDLFVDLTNKTFQILQGCGKFQFSFILVEFENALDGYADFNNCEIERWGVYQQKRTNKICVFVSLRVDREAVDIEYSAFQKMFNSMIKEQSNFIPVLILKEVQSKKNDDSGLLNYLRTKNIVILRREHAERSH